MKKTKIYIYFYLLILIVISLCTNISLNSFNDISDHGPLILKQLTSVSMIVMLFLYFQIIKNYSQEDDISHKGILRLFIVAAVISASIHPTISSDIFYYVSYGIVQGKYNLNPYFTTIESIRSTFTDAPFYALEGVAKIAPMTYGYIYTLYLKLLYVISFKNYYVMFYILKLFNIAAIWAFMSVVIRIKEHFGKNIDNGFIYLLIGLNPLVILEYFANGHNDVIFVLLVSMGIYMIIKEKYFLSGIMFICSFNIKSSAIFILPLIYLYCIKKRVPLKIKVSSLLLFVLSLYPYYLFYGISKMPEGLIVYSNFIDIGFPIVLLSIIMGGQSNIISNFEVFKSVIDFVKSVWICFYAGLLVYFLCKEKDNRIERVMKYIFLSFVLYIFIFSSVMFPWYVIWLIPFILYLDNPKFITTNFAFASFDIAYQAIVMQNFSHTLTSILIYSFIIIYAVYYLYKVYINKASDGSNLKEAIF